MKHLFSEDLDLLNVDGDKVFTEVSIVLHPIVKKYIDAGFSSHDVQQVILDVITYLGSTLRIEKRFKDRRAKEGPKAQPG